MNFEDSLKLKRICDDRGLLVATAESVTVGRLQAMLGAVSGSSTFFRGGITAYHIDQKVALLNVERAHATRVDCVSPQVAAEMAEAATKLFNAHLGLATTGYAEPPDASATSDAFFAIWDSAKSAERQNPVRSGKMTSNNRDRCSTQQFFADWVFQELMAYLEIGERPNLNEATQLAVRIQRLRDGRYQVGEMTVDDISRIDGAVEAVKAPIAITALQIGKPFEVVSGEGLTRGKPGDWLLKGVTGEVYICPDEVFKLSYRITGA